MLHHLTMNVCLAIRLCMMPLAYLYRKLHPPRKSIIAAAWNSVKSWASVLMDLSPEPLKQHPLVLECVRRSFSVYLAVSRVARVFRALYRLGNLLDENPDLLRSRRTSSGTRASEPQRFQSTTTPMDAIMHHASASRVYHAALFEDHNTLDDLFAGFMENEEGPQSDNLQRQHRGSDASGIKHRQSCQRARNRNSSIQTTPERMLARRERRKETAELPLELDGGLEPEDSRTVTQLSSGENITVRNRPLVSYSTTDLTALEARPQSVDEDEKSIVSHGSCHGPEGCAREVARQAQSRLPRRDGSEVAKRNDRKDSVISVEPATPTRKRKLQRRVRTPRT